MRVLLCLVSKQEVRPLKLVIQES